MLLLGLDFETTGLEPGTDRVIEIGAVLWCTDRSAPILFQSELIRHPPEENVELPAIVQQVTGILPEDLQEYGICPREGFMKLNSMIKRASHVVAHNGHAFDQLFYQNEVLRLQLPEEQAAWIDTLTDVPYPDDLTTRKLPYLAAEHGFLNPFPHRAVFDVLTMMKVLSKYDVNEVVCLASSPTVHVRADVSYDDREKAKARGYRWNPKERIWTKQIKEIHLAAEQSQAEFAVLPLQTGMPSENRI